MKPDLAFTGERFTPECVREMSYEHWHRYALAAPLVAGRRALDLACGEGYGSELLARSAATVLGVDRDQQAVEHAARRYQADNLSFVTGNATDIPQPANTFDAIVSFETLEHLLEQEQMLAEFDRVLSDDGFLLLSSPDKAQYSDARDYHNEFHLRELYRDELEALLEAHFPARRLMGQALMFHSCVWTLDPDPSDQTRPWFHTELQADRALAAPAVPPMYFLAVCARKAENLPTLPALSLYSDQAQSVYQHYEHEIRKNMQAGEILIQRDREIEQLRQRIAELENQSNSGTEPGP